MLFPYELISKQSFKISITVDWMLKEYKCELMLIIQPKLKKKES